LLGDSVTTTGTKDSGDSLESRLLLSILVVLKYYTVHAGQVGVVPSLSVNSVNQQTSQTPRWRQGKAETVSASPQPRQALLITQN
jgi:hypothetical protein